MCKLEFLNLSAPVWRCPECGYDEFNEWEREVGVVYECQVCQREYVLGLAVVLQEVVKEKPGEGE